MRQITRQAAEAFINYKPFSKDNTWVAITHVSDGTRISRMLLHGNLIAVKRETERKVLLTLAGWPTVATRERLNGLIAHYAKGSTTPFPRYYQRNGKQYLGGEEINPRTFQSVTVEKVPGVFSRFIAMYPSLLPSPLHKVGLANHFYAFNERIETDEDILAAVSWNWSEEVCENYYATLNL